MSTLDDLQAAGFSEGEVKGYAAEQRQTLSAAGFTDDEINQHLGLPAQPDTLAANKQFSRVVGDALTKASTALKASGETVADIGSVYAPIEAALNAGTGILFGFPAYVGAGLGGLVSKHLLGLDADPKELAETMSRVFTYQPMTQRGQRLAGNVMLPLTVLQEGSEAAGHGVTNVAMKAGASDNVAAALGAVTDASIQMLTPSLLGELHRKMGGQTVTADDMRNTAKVIAGPEATHEAVATVEQGLQSTYQKTGIGPFTVLEDAHKDPQIAGDLTDPNVDVPRAYEEHVEKPAPEQGPVPGDGLPVLDVSGPTVHEVVEQQLAALREEMVAQNNEVVRLQAEATLPPGAPTITNRAGDEFYDTRGGSERFHGSSKPIDSLSDDYALSGDNRNIYGQGFYTTDAADVSNGYMKKGRGGAPSLYKVTEKNAPHLFDMDAPLQPGLKAKAEEIFGPLYRETDINGKDIETLRQLYDEVRAESQGEGYSRDDVQEMFDSMRHHLEQAGYNGLSHVGGKQTGNRAHSVNIYWSPEQHVAIAPADIGAYRAPKSDPQALAQAVERSNALARQYSELKAQRGGAEISPENAAPIDPKQAADNARQLELLDKRRGTLQTLLDCLAAG